MRLILKKNKPTMMDLMSLLCVNCALGGVVMYGAVSYNLFQLSATNLGLATFLIMMLVEPVSMFVMDALDM